MSRVTRIKHLKREDDTDNLDLPTSNQKIARIVKSAGNNLHEVDDSESIENYLVSMPMKFRKSLWIKRGDFVLVEPIAEGGRVKAEIVRVLTVNHIKEYNRMGVWPPKFHNKRDHDDEDKDDANGTGNLGNLNRRITKANENLEEICSASDSDSTN